MDVAAILRQNGLPFVAIASLLALLALLARQIWRAAKRVNRYRLKRILDRFGWDREQLEAKFFDLLRASEDPDHIRWDRLEFSQDVCFVRDRMNHCIAALLEVNICLVCAEAESAGEYPIPRDEQYATAMFHYRRGRWQTNGRVFYNVHPEDAVACFPDQFEPIAAAYAHETSG